MPNMKRRKMKKYLVFSHASISRKKYCVDHCKKNVKTMKSNIAIVKIVKTCGLFASK